MTDTAEDFMADLDKLAPEEDEAPVADVTDGETVEVANEFQLQTKKFALLLMLEKAAAVVPSRDVTPVLKNFLFEVKPGLVRVTGTDMELSVIASTEMVTVQKPGTAVFPASRLLQIIREAKDSEVRITVENGEASIEVAQTSWTLKLASGDEYPALPQPDELDFHQIDRLKFISAIRAVRYAAAGDTLRPSLMQIDVSDGKMRASDGVRYQEIDVSGTIPIDLQIPINAVDNLLKILNTTEAPTFELADDEEDDALIFRIAGDVFIVAKLDAEFPDVNLLKPALANDQELIVDRQELMDAIKRVRITADEETSAIVLHLDSDSVNVTSKDKMNSTAREAVAAKWSSKDKTIAFNHVHLMQMLSMTDAKSCRFLLGEGSPTRPSPILLRDEENHDQLGVLNQVRADWL